MPILAEWKRVVAALEELRKSYFTPHRTHESVAIRLHLLAACVRRAGEFHEETSKTEKKDQEGPCLTGLIKHFLVGVDPHGLPRGKW